MSYDYANLKTFKKSQINGLTKAVSALRWRDWSLDSGQSAFELMDKFLKEIGLAYSCDDDESNGIIYFFTTPRKITKEQTALGKTWLKNHFFKASGEPRRDKVTEKVTDAVLQISAKVSKFEFVGLIGLRNSMGAVVQWLPIYRTYDRKGNYFDYAPVHWGQPIIMEFL